MPSRVPPAPVRASRPGWLLRFTDDQRRRLAVKGRVLGRRALDGIAGLVTPDTILRWYRELVAAKYDGAARRGAGRPETCASPILVGRRMAADSQCRARGPGVLSVHSARTSGVAGPTSLGASRSQASDA